MEPELEERVEERRRELRAKLAELELDDLPRSNAARERIRRRLAEVERILDDGARTTPDALRHQLTRWLQRNQPNLVETELAVLAPPPPSAGVPRRHLLVPSILLVALAVVVPFVIPSLLPESTSRTTTTWTVIGAGGVLMLAIVIAWVLLRSRYRAGGSP